MTPKIQKLASEIEKTRDKISELQTRLQEMEQKKQEWENTEIVTLFRSLNIRPDKLPGFIAAMKTSPALSDEDERAFLSETAPEQEDAGDEA